MALRSLATITERELGIFLEECFDGKLVSIITADEDSVCFELETVWTNHEGVLEPFIDEMTVYRHETECIHANFSIGWEDEEMWQQFMLHFGFHPLLKENPFEKYYVPKAWRFR